MSTAQMSWPPCRMCGHVQGSDAHVYAEARLLREQLAVANETIRLLEQRVAKLQERLAAPMARSVAASSTVPTEQE